MKPFLCLLLTAIACINAVAAEGEARIAYAVVVLCDNQNQGIAPVPAELGNGQQPQANLYWGALYGVKTFFRQHPDWREEKQFSPAPVAPVLARAVFRHGNLILVADAYDGKYMRQGLRAFLNYEPSPIVSLADGLSLNLNDAAVRIFVGHNGLMDARLPLEKSDLKNVACMALCCKSEAYFQPYLQAAGAKGILLTTNLMAPEAYTLEAAFSAWSEGKTGAQIRTAAAQAYAKYQKCNLSAAQNLFAGDDPVKVDNGGGLRLISSLSCPAGYERIAVPENSFAAYMRALPLKPTGSPVLSWDGRIVYKGSEVMGVVDWPLPSKVQQCADVAIKLHAEYSSIHDKSKIHYRSLSGQEISYLNWLGGVYGLNRQGTEIVFHPSRSRKSDTRNELEKYLHFVMLYANSSSLARDLPKVAEKDLLPGDLYIQPDPSGRGGIGHVSIIVDSCRNQLGEMQYLLAYGWTPAQDFMLALPRPVNWFRLQEIKDMLAAFGKGNFQRFDY
jgi:hypothetical protein